METANRGFGRYESAALWIAAILMLVAIALYGWLAGGVPASAPPLVVAGAVHAEPAATAVPEVMPSIPPTALDDALPEEPVPTF
ncbi:MAG: hypothetical protein U1E80_08960 [Piscinibacter sp.]|jgi:hypothetical protein|uniref:hypothetical protein n=1 Tax=Piscinibacter sp. TaxID=1903157 RepID=UPI001B659E77|nr:hypothetical protein [Piscinibacter sp.]MBP5990908.1 hypothetical protein [Piscinibacter sp.]MBP6028454.1 hypothetical protein [Piscinibacter sp.]MBS0434757.1 hypothetical protein [Pseudomonadota bacterium]MBS0443252.1 hypothetical protein [Pseudomonadota bacterium]